MSLWWLGALGVAGSGAVLSAWAAAVLRREGRATDRLTAAVRQARATVAGAPTRLPGLPRVEERTPRR
jgi:hypothetical protein